ncbi:hypothetical protein BKA66DRAFT_465217 [Pyrenochaeta sp. MPI-SDFR-AT-0127]|nr:hypothetical protein BKA66DRAFT_465217 [Pyrenochaeta sp. MPI-SDFR-AT-0127]
MQIIPNYSNCPPQPSLRYLLRSHCIGRLTYQGIFRAQGRCFLTPQFLSTKSNEPSTPTWGNAVPSSTDKLGSLVPGYARVGGDGGRHW